MRHHSLYMSGVVNPLPSRPAHIFEGRTRILVPAVVVPARIAELIARPCELVDVIGQLAKALFTFSQSRFNAFAFGDLQSGADYGIPTHWEDRDEKVLLFNTGLVTRELTGSQNLRAQSGSAHRLIRQDFAQGSPNECLPRKAQHLQSVFIRVAIDPILDLARSVPLRFEHHGQLGGVLENGAHLVIALGERFCVLLTGERSSLLQFEVERLQLAAPLVQFHEDRDLAAQDLRDDRNGDVVDGPDLIAFELVELGDVHARDKHNGGALEARMSPNESRQLETVHSRHVHIQQDGRELLLHEPSQRLLP